MDTTVITMFDADERGIDDVMDVALQIAWKAARRAAREGLIGMGLVEVSPPDDNNDITADRDRAAGIDNMNLPASETPRTQEATTPLRPVPPRTWHPMRVLVIPLAGAGPAARSSVIHVRRVVDLTRSVRSTRRA